MHDVITLRCDGTTNNNKLLFIAIHVETALVGGMSKIPVIQARKLFAKCRASNEPEEQVCVEIREACETWGVFQLVDSGFEQELLHRTVKAVQEFFDLPLATKMQVKRRQDNPSGWADDELTKQKKDLKEIFDFCFVPHRDLPDDDPRNRTIDGTNQFPKQEPEIRRTLLEYFDEMQRCAFKLLECFCLSLNIDFEVMRKLFLDGVGFCRLNFYEPLHSHPEEETHDSTPMLGIQPHTDAGFLTILWSSSVPGLEVYRNQEWVKVQPLADSFTINVGDVCSVFSNGTFKAPLHRVRAPLLERRISIPFFFNPSPSTVVKPLEACVSKDSPAKYREFTWQEFREKRFEGDYSDKGEEVQISHYLIESES